MLDEDMAPRLAAVLTALGHPSEHVREVGMTGAPDEDVVKRARDYDALITLDLHRQEREWFAVNEAMFAETKVIRVRFKPKEDESLMGQTRALVAKWSEVEHAVMEESAVRLITITAAGTKVRSNTVEQLEARVEGWQS